jgi:hypothetical protein
MASTVGAQSVCSWQRGVWPPGIRIRVCVGPRAAQRSVAGRLCAGALARPEKRTK